MPNYKQVDLSKVKTISIKTRKSKVRFQDFAKVFNPGGGEFRDFAAAFPRILAAEDLRKFVDDVALARERGKPVLALLGAHVIKVGLSPLLVDLMDKKIVSGIAMNGAAAIHDVETALWGVTSEDVEESITEGKFGMSKETGDFINGTLKSSLKGSKAGFGEVLGKALQKAPNRKLSILAACWKLDVPVTVHAAIGTDIIHQQPSMDGAATGEMTFRDFKVLCELVKGLKKGGVVMNIGSAVVLPEVFLKALTVARNLGADAGGFTAANFDMIQHYRPRMNIVHRPTLGGGRGYLFTGHHEIMIPLLCAMIKQKLNIR